jgi:hypothetical protein
MQHTSDYVSCRDRFRKSAQDAGFTLSTALIPGSGKKNEELTQDYAYLDRSSEVTLIHLSGVHGVEGYLGSLIQDEILQDPSLLKNIRCNLLFVHAVNPYGMSWARRTNGNNIDLNRNALSGISGQQPQNKEAVRFQKFLQSRSLGEILLHLPQLLVTALPMGIPKATQAIAGGQWEFPQSVFYGGQELQPELIQLIHKIKELTHPTKKYFILDVHTGLGPFAYDSLLAPLVQHQQIPFFIQATQEGHGRSHVIDLTRTDQMYQSQGSMEHHFVRNLAGKEIFYLVQEFGTRSALSVLFALIRENSMFQTAGPQAPGRHPLLLDSFFPASKRWRKTCTELGKKRFFQILQAL